MTWPCRGCVGGEPGSAGPGGSVLWASMPSARVPAVGQITIRGTSAELPVFDEVDLEPVSSLGTAGGSVSGFEFGRASVRALDVKDVRLLNGRIAACPTIQCRSACRPAATDCASFQGIDSPTGGS